MGFAIPCWNSYLTVFCNPVPAMTSTSALHRKYTTWLAERGYQPMSADELSRQIQGHQPRSSLPADKLVDVQWLDGFIRE